MISWTARLLKNDEDEKRLSRRKRRLLRRLISWGMLIWEVSVF